MSATKPSKAMLCNKTPKGYAMHPQTWGLLYELSGFSGQLNYHSRRRKHKSKLLTKHEDRYNMRIDFYSRMEPSTFHVFTHEYPFLACDHV